MTATVVRAVKNRCESNTEPSGDVRFGLGPESSSSGDCFVLEIHSRLCPDFSFLYNSFRAMLNKFEHVAVYTYVYVVEYDVRDILLSLFFTHRCR